MLSNPIMQLLDKQSKRSQILINVGIPATASTTILTVITLVTAIIIMMIIILPPLSSGACQGKLFGAGSAQDFLTLI